MALLKADWQAQKNFQLLEEISNRPSGDHGISSINFSPREWEAT